jgi:hypothetical protein
MSTRRYFNSGKLNPRTPSSIKSVKSHKNTITKSSKKPHKLRSQSNNNRFKPLSSSNNLIVKSGMPYDTILSPINGQLYVDKDTGNTYLYADSLGWIDMSGWQPDVGEGVPDISNPPNPISGDQYLNILNGDLYVFNEGLGWVMLNGIEGPRGPPGDTFSFDLETYQDGVTGPLLSGPFKIEAGKCVRLWIENGQIHADVI